GLPRQGTYEGGPAAGDDGASLRLELTDRLGDDLHVGVLGGVDDHPAPVPGAGQDLAHTGRAAGADVIQADAEHLGRADRAAGALLEEFAQVGVGEAEGGIAGEVGLADLDRGPVDHGVVDVALGEAPGLDHGRAQDDRVDLDVVVGELLGEGERFGDHVAAQGRVGAGDHVQTACGDATVEHTAQDATVHRHRFILVQG